MADPDASGPEDLVDGIRRAGRTAAGPYFPDFAGSPEDCINRMALLRKKRNGKSKVIG